MDDQALEKLIVDSVAAASRQIGENVARERQTGWHLRREVTVGNILTTVAAVATISLVLVSQDKRISLNEQAIINVRESSQERQTWMETALSKIESTMNRIEDRISRKADK